MGGLLICTQLTGCMGQMGLSQLVTSVNLKAVDNRYAREGLYILMSPVYGFAAMGDVFVVNAIEFWTGTNPVTGKSPALVDTPMSAVIKVNHKINKELTTAPLKITKTDFHKLDNDTLAMTATFDDGSQQVIKGKKVGDKVDFYVNNNFVTSASTDELNDYMAHRA